MRLAVVPIPGTRPEGVLFSAHQLPRLLEVARLADDMGVPDLGLSEHVLMAYDAASYPFGRFPHTTAEPFPEPMMTLCAMAAVTSKIRLISTIVIAPLRPAALLAKQAATLHALSNGRFVFGVSTSWHREEYAAMGVPFEQRGARLDDALGACRALWASAPASFSSASVSFKDMYCVPRPDDPEAIPVWIGGALSPRIVKRVARFGQGWMPFIGTEPKPLEMIARGVEQMREAMHAQGRNGDALEVSALLMPRDRPLDVALDEELPGLQRAGVSHLRVQLSSFVAAYEDIEPFMERLMLRPWTLD
jgi:probable F420-dependent oxidoreductase